MSPAEHSVSAWVDVARGRATIARIALGIAIAIRALTWAWTLLGMLLMGGIPEVDPLWTEWWDPSLFLITALWLLAYFAAGIAVVGSQRAFTRCLGWFGVGQPDPGLAWGTWSWIVPFANLVVPYRAFRQLAEVLPDATRRIVRRSVGRWWAFWLTGSFLTALGGNLSLLSETPRPWLVASAVELVGSALLIAAGLLLIGMLGRLTTEYRRLAAEREERLLRETEERLSEESAGFQLSIPVESLALADSTPA